MNERGRSGEIQYKMVLYSARTVNSDDFLFAFVFFYLILDELQYVPGIELQFS